MKLYENKREIALWTALKMLFVDEVPGHDFEYMIDAYGNKRLIAFGKTWTKKDTSRWGKLVPKFWIHEEHCPTLAYDNIDLFLLDLFNVKGVIKYFDEKQFCVWEEVK